jgi:uncharacterized protein
MIISVFNARKLAKVLKGFNKVKQAAFGASCCDRLIPNYRVYQSDKKGGDIKPLFEANKTIWNWIIGIPCPRERVLTLLKECRRVMPDLDESDSEHSLYGLTASCAICAVLEFIKDKRITSIVSAAEQVTDSIDNFVQELEGMDADTEDREELILHHPLMQKELRNQLESLIYLKEVNNFDKKAANEFRAKFKHRNVLCTYK